MNTTKQIKIVSKLIESTKELDILSPKLHYNIIDDGEDLLRYLINKQKYDEKTDK